MRNPKARKHPVQRQWLFWVFCLVLAVGSYWLVQRVWDANAYYSQGFRQEIEAREPAASGKSREIHGTRESDIRKYRGNRYDTW